MKRFFRIAAMATLFGMASSVRADSVADFRPPTQAVEAAKALTKITGVAISPLLGMAAVGAYDYYTAPKEKKAHLPWYAHPRFWVPALLFVGTIAAKDCLGTVLPPGVKKPIDAIEVIENKVSGILATGAFVPFVASIFGTLSSNGGNTTAAGHPVHLAGLATFQFGPLWNVLAVPLAITVFVLVWLLGHVVSILILVSPFGVVDAALKSLRTSLMGLVALTSFVNPWAGAVLSIIIIVVAYFLAGWSFRLTVFGTVYVWDFMTSHRNRFRPAPEANWVFTAQRIEKTPIRTYGRLLRGEQGKLTIEYRSLSIAGPKRTLAMPEGKYAVGRGLFHSEIIFVEQGGTGGNVLLTLPPRYRSHEEVVAKIYSIQEVRDVGLLRGFKAIWNWLKRLFGSGAHGEAST